MIRAGFVIRALSVIVSDTWGSVCELGWTAIQAGLAMQAEFAQMGSATDPS